jgi:hypothetical protein
VAELVLGPMLRYVSETSATVWVETDQRCTVEVLGRTTPTFCVAGHHYALAIIEDLTPASSSEYDVRLDDVVCWPVPGSTLPASRIRTLGVGRSSRIVFGSCRTAAPHTAPWALELALDERGRGVDALYAYGLRMVDQPVDEWPELAVFLGDQVYADDSSPHTRECVARNRQDLNGGAESTLPSELVAGFEEFTWLYHEAWSPEIERWFFSNVPSVMIFDDHDMIDDWNISDTWVRDIRQEDWWQDHIIGGLMTYWLYQHLGNLSPEIIRSEGILDALAQVEDGEATLREWAQKSEEFTPVAGGYQFSFVRDIGRVRLVMIDARNGRVLEPGRRQIVDDGEWDWIVRACHADVDHLLIGTSLPVFVPGGLHDLQAWSEAICDGAWGRPGRRLGEWTRRKADMEDWPAFIRSFDQFVELLQDVGARSRSAPPATISVLSGDIHFSYASELCFPTYRKPSSRVHQLVNSPIRNALTPPERTAMRLGRSRLARVLGRVLRWAVRGQRRQVTWEADRGPVFGNCLGQISFEGRAAQLVLQQTCPYNEDAGPELKKVIELDLVAGSRSTPQDIAG